MRRTDDTASVVTLSTPWPISRGESRPLGATVCEGGVNFSLYSASATGVELLLFENYDDTAPLQTIRLESRHHRTFHYWHVFVHGIGPGQLYGYRVIGPESPGDGHRFDPAKVLVDPYARGLVYGTNWSREAACAPGDNTSSSMKSLVVDVTGYDWQSVTPPRINPTERIIYELHVGGFTRDPSSGVLYPGTFDGLVEKIPYLLDLGITTVELLPVFQFDETAPTQVDPRSGERLRDFWGYNPLGFFAPHRGYYTEGWGQMRELTGFRDLVRAFHRAGIEVFLDVVFNHTTEGAADGPTLSFRGIENRAYYHLDPDDASKYVDYSGCGNAMNCNHPVVRRLILDSLRYWTSVMHVDGFRFDLASVLARDEAGRTGAAAPLTWEIESDPILQDVSLIAEAWDAAGLYQVGAFPGERWSEWNGRFRDDVRRFLRGDPGTVGKLATRMMGSPDLYEARGHSPSQCVNFVTCHDGFTLNDLVSYARKHNLANGEDERDGSNENLSWNHGVEGPSTDPAVERARERDIRNAFAITLLSQGTPMILAGDELRNSQGGNNNAWCQDNPTGWLDWDGLHRHASLHAYVRDMIAFRRRHPSLHRSRYLLGADAPRDLDPDGYTRVRWHGETPDAPDWSDRARLLVFTLSESRNDDALLIAVSNDDDARTVTLPAPPLGTRWRVAVDTSAADPVRHETTAPPAPDALRLPGRSVVVLVAVQV